ncbi:C39 family peptidase [Nocardia thailandica]|uniref:C39 family peptidase n=1 Tax=Nocardia thailandica TaxID=257275 RepID=UPI000306BED0|nr:C39 family peptidase [Nocardia thailandica]
MAEKVLPYDRRWVTQETGWYCGPASAQTILQSRGIFVEESQLAREIGTTWNGTDYVGLIEPVLNAHLGQDVYVSRYLEVDPAAPEQVERLWRDIVASIEAGFGVVANIVAPVDNYPRGVRGSVSPSYSGGTVYHYIAVMGYSDEDGARSVWIADSGFRPFGYWLSFAQLATLIPPKGYAAAPVGPPPPPPPGLTAEVLSDAMGAALPLERYRELLPAVTEALRAAGCTTVDRAAMWMAQVGHESAGLRYMEELADGSAYEGRADLGNTQPGDGRRFKGRGPIQITGRHNYAAVSAWAFAQGLVPTATYFVDNPAELGTDRYAFAGVTWYWTVARQMNRFADAADIEGATRAVNGGLTNLDDRVDRWNHARALGAALLPEEDSTMAALTPEEQRELLDGVRYIRDQLGPGVDDWGEDGDLGRNAKGQRLTLRAGLAKLIRKVGA